MIELTDTASEEAIEHLGAALRDPVRRLARAGWEIDSHSLTHPDLTRLSAAIVHLDRGRPESLVEFSLDIAQAKGVLNGRPVKACRHLADCTAANLDQWMASDLNRMFGTSIDFDPSRLTAGAARMRLRMALECGLAEGRQANRRVELVVQK